MSDSEKGVDIRTTEAWLGVSEKTMYEFAGGDAGAYVGGALTTAAEAGVTIYGGYLAKPISTLETCGESLGGWTGYAAKAAIGSASVFLHALALSVFGKSGGWKGVGSAALDAALDPFTPDVKILGDFGINLIDKGGGVVIGSCAKGVEIVGRGNIDLASLRAVQISGAGGGVAGGGVLLSQKKGENYVEIDDTWFKVRGEAGSIRLRQKLNMQGDTGTNVISSDGTINVIARKKDINIIATKEDINIEAKADDIEIKAKEEIILDAYGKWKLDMNSSSINLGADKKTNTLYIEKNTARIAVKSKQKLEVTSSGILLKHGSGKLTCKSAKWEINKKLKVK